MNCGSGESLKASVWWGLSPNARQMRLTAVGDPGRGRHPARRPVRGVRRLLLQRLDDHPLDVLVADRARLARARLVMQPIKATLGEAPPPAPDGRRRAPQPRRDLLAGLPVRRRQHDPERNASRLRALLGRRAQRCSTSRSSSLSTTSTRRAMTAPNRG